MKWISPEFIECLALIGRRIRKSELAAWTIIIALCAGFWFIFFHLPVSHHNAAEGPQARP